MADLHEPPMLAQVSCLPSPPADQQDNHSCFSSYLPAFRHQDEYYLQEILLTTALLEILLTTALQQKEGVCTRALSLARARLKPRGRMGIALRHAAPSTRQT